MTADMDGDQPVVIRGHIDPYSGPEPWMVPIDGEVVETREISAMFGQPVSDEFDEAEDDDIDPE